MIFIAGRKYSSIGSREISLAAKAWINRYEKLQLDDANPVILPPDTSPWGDDFMYDLADFCPQEAFLVIDEILLRTNDESVLCHLATGPLEDLLRGHGEAVMPQIESRIKNSAKFRELFSWVYPYSFQDLWKRIQVLVKEVNDHDE